MPVRGLIREGVSCRVVAPFCNYTFKLGAACKNKLMAPPFSSNMYYTHFLISIFVCLYNSQVQKVWRRKMRWWKKKMLWKLRKNTGFPTHLSLFSIISVLITLIWGTSSRLMPPKTYDGVARRPIRMQKGVAATQSTCDFGTTVAMGVACRVCVPFLWYSSFFFYLI